MIPGAKRAAAPRILVVDNYDSFTYNLVQYLLELGAKVQVHRNDALDVSSVRAMAVDGILLGPGPGRPEDAGVTLALLEVLANAASAGAEPPAVLGVCLGHQCIAQSFGGRIVRAERLMHGRTSPIHHDGRGLFAEAPNPFVATRYHSLVVDTGSLEAHSSTALKVTAWTDQGEIMGLRHLTHRIEGVQFHPESFLTEQGHALLGAWLRQCQRDVP